MRAILSSTNNASLRLNLPCDIDQVRSIARQAREFFASQGLSEEDLMGCELVMVEACNNAVNYVMPSRQLEAIEIDLSCDSTKIEIRIRDHTGGFELPEKVALTNEDSETGRGLFIIQSLMDEVKYAGAMGDNTLTLRKSRSPVPSPPPPESIATIKARLAESEQVIDEMAEELSSCYESLSAIFRSGTELGKTDNLQNFSRALCEDLLKITSAEWFLLRIVPQRSTSLSVFVSSNPGQHIPPLVTDISKASSSAELKAAAYRKDLLFSLENPLDPSDPLQAMPPAVVGLVHPFYFSETLIGTLTIGKKSNDRLFTAAHMNVVQTLADFLAIQIVNARIHEAQLGNRLVTRELEIARSIQRALLPKKLPQLSGFGMAGYCQSARHVGGDFYDVVSINDHSALLIIADVMGKGVPAAMFAAILRSVCRGAPELLNQPAALLSRVNTLMHDDLSHVEMFITAQLAFIDVQVREVVVASAGHCPVLLFTENKSEPKLISPDGMPLGILSNSTFAEVKETLSPNCRLVLYTDGVTESRNSNDQFFGHKRLVEWMELRASGLRTAQELKESLTAELHGFQEDAAPSDDQTFLILAEDNS